MERIGSQTLVLVILLVIAAAALLAGRPSSDGVPSGQSVKNSSTQTESAEPADSSLPTRSSSEPARSAKPESDPPQPTDTGSVAAAAESLTTDQAETNNAAPPKNFPFGNSAAENAPVHLHHPAIAASHRSAADHGAEDPRAVSAEDRGGTESAQRAATLPNEMISPGLAPAANGPPNTNGPPSANGAPNTNEPSNLNGAQNVNGAVHAGGSLNADELPHPGSGFPTPNVRTVSGSRESDFAGIGGPDALPENQTTTTSGHRRTGTPDGINDWSRYLPPPPSTGPSASASTSDAPEETPARSDAAASAGMTSASPGFGAPTSTPTNRTPANRTPAGSNLPASHLPASGPSVPTTSMPASPDINGEKQPRSFPFNRN